eukprot:764403-Prymnesium_polylepis.1
MVQSASPKLTCAMTCGWSDLSRIAHSDHLIWISGTRPQTQQTALRVRSRLLGASLDAGADVVPPYVA